MNKEPQDIIVKWIKGEKDRIKNLSLIDLSFPCKIANKVYKNEPIFVRAYNNSQARNPKFKLNKGELFYYIFVKSLGRDKKGKEVNVLGITETEQFDNLRSFIDWDEIERRVIIGKADPIFQMLGWGNIKMLLSNQMTLF